METATDLAPPGRRRRRFAEDERPRRKLSRVFRLTEKQVKALAVLASFAMYIMLFGGSRSGKTFLIIRAIVVRALKASGSRHVIFRLRFIDNKTSIALDTFPKVMSLCFPDVKYVLNRSDWYATFPNGSEIWFGGLDDKERTEKILGREYVTLYFNEVSQIPYNSIEMAFTRLAQYVMQDDGNGEVRELPLKCYFDCNPPAKTHWCYRMFIQKLDPNTRQPLKNPHMYASMVMNPLDNKENISATYIEQVLKNLTGEKRKRFLEGKFTDAIPNALWTDESIDRVRLDGGSALPYFLRVIIGVDPSGAGDADENPHDEIGIVVGAMGKDGRGYLIKDLSVLAPPAVWGRVVATAYDDNMGDCVVGEVNYGGAMVEFVIKTAKPLIKYKSINASRGKAVRAEPISALYDEKNDKIRHVGFFPELESELTSFSSYGYMGEGSPNRADAWIWVVTELFPDVVGTRGHAGAMR